VGNAEGGISPFESMKDIVMTSPMTSMILITDLPEEEVNERAEGYGILGYVNREISSKDLLKLIKGFEEIFRSFAPARSYKMHKKLCMMHIFLCMSSISLLFLHLLIQTNYMIIACLCLMSQPPEKYAFYSFQSIER
ncbi:hypothetical protein KA005_19180, partial [bacterium]|nr:hypothetical protein [bacterium]